MTNNKITIDDREFGICQPCLIIAEVGLVHDGSLGAAHAFIDAVSTTGADAIKFQTHIASAESSSNETFRTNSFIQDETRYKYWERTSFTENEWLGLKKHAEEKNLIFLSTPFSIEAVRLLRRIGVKAWKIGSGESNNLLLLDELAKKNEPILLSSGMSFLSELDVSIKRLQEKKIPLLLLQCTNKYPCPPESLGLNMIEEYRERYNIPVGFSDHSGEIGPCLAAVTMGAKAIEVHVTWHKASFGPDVKASLTIEHIALLTKNIRIIEKAMLHPVNKDQMAEEMGDMRNLFMKGLVAKIDICKNDIITENHIDSRKPCIGIPAYDYEKIIGKPAIRSIKVGDSIHWKDIN